MTGARLIKRRGVPPWAVTFADMMALLVALFVMMLSFSEMNLQRYKQIVVSMQESFTPDAFVRQVLVIVDPSAVPDGVEVVILDVDAQIPTTPPEQETTSHRKRRSHRNKRVKAPPFSSSSGSWPMNWRPR